MSYRPIQILIIFLIITAVITGAIYFKNSDPLNADPVIRVNIHNTTTIEGLLNKDSSTVEFESRMETSSRVSVQVRVHDLILDAVAELDANGQKKLVIIDGHGKLMTLKNKEALTELAKLLEHQLDPYKQDVLPHEDLLVRTVNLWAEAPVGFQLTRQEIRP
jgi:hypothetical protein